MKLKLVICCCVCWSYAAIAADVPSFRCKQGVIKLGDSRQDVQRRCSKQMQGNNYLTGGAGKHDAKLKFKSGELTRIKLVRPAKGMFR